MQRSSFQHTLFLFLAGFAISTRDLGAESPSPSGELSPVPAVSAPPQPGCEPNPKFLFSRVRKELKGKPDTIVRKAEKQGNRVIYVDAIASAAGDYTRAKKVLSNFGGYPDWLLAQINESRKGKFKFELLSVQYEPEQSVLRLFFEYHHPILGKKVERAWTIKAVQSADMLCIEGQTVPDDSTLIERSTAIFYMWPAEGEPGRLWFHFTGAAQLRSWVIYQFVSESMLNRETGERIPIFLKNFLDRHAQPPLILEK